MKKEFYIAAVLSLGIFVGSLTAFAGGGLWKAKCVSNDKRQAAYELQLKGMNDTLMLIEADGVTEAERDHVDNLNSLILTVEAEINCLKTLNGSAEHTPCLTNEYVNLWTHYCSS